LILRVYEKEGVYAKEGGWGDIPVIKFDQFMWHTKTFWYAFF